MSKLSWRCSCSCKFEGQIGNFFSDVKKSIQHEARSDSLCFSQCCCKCWSLPMLCSGLQSQSWQFLMSSNINRFNKQHSFHAQNILTGGGGLCWRRTRVQKSTFTANMFRWTDPPEFSVVRGERRGVPDSVWSESVVCDQQNWELWHLVSRLRSSSVLWSGSVVPVLWPCVCPALLSPAHCPPLWHWSLCLHTWVQSPASPGHPW